MASSWPDWTTESAPSLRFKREKIIKKELFLKPYKDFIQINWIFFLRKWTLSVEIAQAV